ncbi:MAG TPA: hypothetical protein VIU61_17045 [Kofleriaceae bacterium]
MSKWEEKQRRAKEAEAKFEENQRRAQQAKAKGTAAQLDEMAAGLAIDSKPATAWEHVLGFVMGRWKTFATIFVVLAAGGIGFGVCKCVQHRLRVVPGTPVNELFVASPAGDTLIVIDHVKIGGGTDNRGRVSSTTAEGGRLIAIDAATGKQLAVVVEDYNECWVAATRVWCVDKYAEVHLLDGRTLAMVAEAKDLIAKAKLAKPTRQHTRAGEDVIVVLADGRGAQISPTTLVVTQVESVESRFDPFANMRTKSCVTTSHANGFALRGGGTRNTLTTDPPPPAEGTPSGPALTFLEGAFLVTAAPVPLVLHRQLMDGPHQVARVETASKQRWNVPLPGVCRAAFVSGGVLVVAAENRNARAVGIDLETGAIRWQFTL